MPEYSFFKKHFASQKQKWIVAEGMIVLALIVFLVIYSFTSWYTLRANVEIYQEYGDSAARAAYANQ